LGRERQKIARTMRVLAFAHQPSARRVYQPAAPLRNGPSPASAADSRREQAVARERILVQLGHKAAEAVDPLPQIGRGRKGPPVESPRAPDNPSARSSALAVARSSPSTRYPPRDTTTSAAGERMPAVGLTEPLDHGSGCSVLTLLRWTPLTP